MINTVITPITKPFPTIGLNKEGIKFNTSSGANDNNRATINGNPTTTPLSKSVIAFSLTNICSPAANCVAIK